MVQEIRARMEDAGYSDSSLSRAVGIPQSTLWRALRTPVRTTKTHLKLCKFFGIDLQKDSTNVDARENLMQELLDVWDGSREHAQTLARLLRSAAALQAHAAAQATRSR